MRDPLVWIGSAIAGAASVVVALRLLPSAFRRPPHLRSNYRGRTVIGTAGVVLVVPLAIGTALALGGVERNVVATILGSGVAFALLGYLDDVYGSRHAGGFVGHARELAHGRLTTGAVKAFGGGAIGLAAAWTSGRRGIWVLVGGAVVALGANITNLLDLRPGRALKVWLPCAIALLVVGIRGDGELAVAAVGGGAVAFLVYELRENVMLGDTGAGLLGGILAVAAVASLRHIVLTGLLAGLVALTVASEAVSFTRVIEAVPPLRWLDALGRGDRRTS